MQDAIVGAVVPRAGIVEPVLQIAQIVDQFAIDCRQGLDLPLCLLLFALQDHQAVGQAFDGLGVAERRFRATPAKVFAEIGDDASRGGADDQCHENNGDRNPHHTLTPIRGEKGRLGRGTVRRISSDMGRQCRREKAITAEGRIFAPLPERNR